MVTQLSRAGAIPEGFVAALSEIVPVLNQAVHGARISTGTALDVARAGKQLMGLLYYFAQNPPRPNTSQKDG